MKKLTKSLQSEEIVPRRLELIPHSIRQLDEKITQHRRYLYAVYPKWFCYSTQRHIQQAAIDSHRKVVWMATWGGILAWSPKEQVCVRHTSEHGLIGNAQRGVVVDAIGTVWAAGHLGGLSSLALDETSTWKTHPEFSSWTVKKMVPCPGEGVYLSIQNSAGEMAIGKITNHEPLMILHTGGLESLDLMAMIVTKEENQLWVGNGWGLHCLKDTKDFESFDLEGSQIRSLAEAIGGGFWVGTNNGLYRFRKERDIQVTQDEEWPHSEILDLRIEPESGNLWAITPELIGRLSNNSWQPIRENLPFETGLSRFSRYDDFSNPFSDWISEGNILVSGPEGLFEVGMEFSNPVLAYSDEDQLSNAVQAIYVQKNKIWIGSARGLYEYDGSHWRNHTSDTKDLLDVRAISNGQVTDHLVVGSWLSGLHRFIEGVHIPEQGMQERIVSMTLDVNTALWVATINAVFFKKDEASPWQLIQPSASTQIGDAIIRTICYQLVKEASGEIVPSVWVGTSNGLLRYRPNLQLWDRVSGDLDHSSVKS